MCFKLKCGIGIKALLAFCQGGCVILFMYTVYIFFSLSFSTGFFYTFTNVMDCEGFFCLIVERFVSIWTEVNFC